MSADVELALREAQFRVTSTEEALRQLGMELGYKIIPARNSASVDTDNVSSGLSERPEAEESAPENSSSGETDSPVFVPNAIYNALVQLSEPLANSYAQVKRDVQDTHRSSWAGTAHEIRQTLVSMLWLLAPDDLVKARPWYRQDMNTTGPTQKQRVLYILEQNGAGSKQQEVVEQVVALDEMIGNWVRAIYSRASDAAHRSKDKKEVIRILNYFEAFAPDLLNLD